MWPPLFFAIEQHKEWAVSLLIEHGADVNESAHGVTALMLVAGTGNISIARGLIIASAKVTTRDYSHRTALHCAAINGQEGIIELLLANGAELDSSDDQGITTLMLAVENLQYKAAEVLKSRRLP
ncbi:ankyrin repeat-containing domain protein [Aspergillus fruticulosus]